MPIAFGQRRKDFTEMTIDCGEGFHKGVLAQRGDGFDTKQQFFAFTIQHV